jgi:hypothetical protein
VRPKEGSPVLDVFFLAVTGVFFAAFIGFVFVCERL